MVSQHFLKQIVCVVLLALTCAGCDDNFLFTAPEGSVSERNFWRTEQDARIAVNDLYNFLHQGQIFSWDAIADIGAVKVFRPERFYITGQQNATTGFGNNEWYRSYDGIRAVNDFLKNVQNVEADDPQLITRYKAEARFIRAYLYAYLVMFFGDVPLIESPITIEESRELTRTDKEQVWDFIAGELDEISGDLPPDYNSDNAGRITQGAAWALKARAMLWAGRYREAADAAKQVMDSGVYSLYPSYENLFSYQAENNSEVVLQKVFVKNDYSNAVFQFIGPFSQQSSNTHIVPSKNLVDAYEMSNGMAIDEPGSGYDPGNPYENRDPRLDYSIFVLGDTLPNGQTYDPRPGFGGADDISRGFSTTITGFNIEKYINPEDLQEPANSGINFILLRYAEVLLTYAEAKIELGETDQTVYDAINEVRQRPDVDMPPVNPPKTQDELRQIVRHERLVELAFEGLRYFDILRWEIAPEVRNGTIYGMTYEDQNGELQTVEVEDYQRNFQQEDYLWPLPQKEVELNTNLEQNPGY